MSRQLILRANDALRESTRESIHFLNVVWETERLHCHVKIVEAIESTRFLRHFYNLRVGQNMPAIGRLSFLLNEGGSYTAAVSSYIDENVECLTARSIIGVGEEPIIPSINGPVAVRIPRGLV